MVVLLAHPNMKESQANKALVDAISDLEQVAIYNLYEMHSEETFDVDTWSTIISHGTGLVFQFPFHGMSAPSLLKRWMDELLRPYQVSATHAGMVWQTPHIVYGMGTAEVYKNIAEGANLYNQRIESLIQKDAANDSW